MRLAKMLRLYLSVNNITARALAEEIGINPSTLSRFITGKALPDAEGLARILTWFLSADRPQPQKAIEEATA